MIALTLNHDHVSKVFRATGNVLSRRSCFAGVMLCVGNKRVGYVGASRGMAVASERTLGGGVCCFVRSCVI